MLYGGLGPDIFVYSQVSQSAFKHADVIMDFDGSVDSIDLSTLDADSTQTGQQHFTGAPFSGTPPAGTYTATELYDSKGNDTGYLAFNFYTDKDADPDFVLGLYRPQNFTIDNIHFWARRYSYRPHWGGSRFRTDPDVSRNRR